MSERTIENVREYNLDPKEVVKGLNGYYESDKCNGYITVRRNDVEGPAYFTTALYLSALIEWLRVDHDIFYRPGLTLDQIEAARNAAKMRSLRAHIKHELDMRDLWFDKNADIPELVDTLFKALDCCDERADDNRKEAKYIILQGIMDYVRKEASRNGFDLPEEIDGEPLTVKRVFHDLLELLRKKETEIRDAEQKTRNAVNEQLKKDTDYVVDTLCDILEALGVSKSDTVHLDMFGLKTKAIQRASAIKSEHDRYLEQLDKAAADYQALDKEYRELKSSQKSDTNALIRDCCLRYNIVAPSRYLSDRASVEYVISLLDSYRKQRNEAYVNRDRAVDDYKLNLKDYILHDIKKHGYRYDGLETKSIADIVDWIITMATCANKSHISDRIHEICNAKGVELDDAFLYDDDYTWEDLVGFLCEEIRKLKKEVEDAKKETKRKCYWYLWEALKKLSPECDALKINTYEELVDRIFFEMCFVTENCKQCQRKHSTEKLNYIRRANKAEEEVKELNDVIKKLKQLLNEISKEEDEGWFKP